MLILNIVLMILGLGTLFFLQKIHVSFNKRVLVALTFGVLFGYITHFQSSFVVDYTLDIYAVVGVGYMRFLQMMIFPIVTVATLYAMTKIGDSNTTKNIFTPIILVISVLLITTGIAAILGIIFTFALQLNLDTLVNNVYVPNNDIMLSLEGKSSSLLNKPLSSLITDFITINPFQDLSGLRSNSIASLVIFLIFVGIAYLGVLRKEPDIAIKFKNAIEVLYKIVMRLVVLVLRLTPYGILALVFKIVASISYNEVMNLVKFVLVTYLSIISMFGVHLLLLVIMRYNPMLYLKKVYNVLLFAFFSRSSASVIPMNINTQVNSLGVNETLATSSASFGAILGQNGCAGIYPAILAVVTAPAVGIDPLSWSFLLTLIPVIMISSFGIAGVGGGAAFAAIAVFSVYDMPLTLVALLFSIEPLLDMARTALNVNGAITSSLIVAKLTNNINLTIYNSQQKLDNNYELDI